jgi:hypothetical protein
MLVGKFCLSKPVLVLEVNDNRMTAVTLPSGVIVTVVDQPKRQDPRMIEVSWQGKHFTMFEIDLSERGQRVEGASAHP